MDSGAQHIWGALATDPDETIALWPGTPPGGENLRLTPVITERSNNPDFKDRAATGIAQPLLTVFRPEQPDGSALIIAAGGNYIRVVLDKEGFESGRLFREQGITVFVLRYRLPFEGWHTDAPLQDAQRAIRLVRARAKEFSVDPSRIGMVGFSAGGHVAASLATCHAQKTHAPVDEADALSARPDFAALFYPIITMLEPHVFADGRDAVLGTDASPEKRARFSRELCVDAQTPPCFLLTARDDDVIPVGNTQLMAAAMRAANIPAEVHIFEKGGHGFGIRLATGKPVAIWPELFLNWGRAMGYFAPAEDRRPA
jgi:acetyl esterase/lipase